MERKLKPGLVVLLIVAVITAMLGIDPKSVVPGWILLISSGLLGLVYWRLK